MTPATHPSGRWRWLPPAVLGILALSAAGVFLRAGTSSPRRHRVMMQGMAFQPAFLEVTQGDTIVWTNRDIVPHTATSEASPAWTTGALTQGESGRYVARTAGEIRYFCELHLGMRGTIKVR